MQDFLLQTELLGLHSKHCTNRRRTRHAERVVWVAVDKVGSALREREVRVIAVVGARGLEAQVVVEEGLLVLAGACDEELHGESREAEHRHDDSGHLSGGAEALAEERREDVGRVRSGPEDQEGGAGSFGALEVGAVHDELLDLLVRVGLSAGVVLGARVGDLLHGFEALALGAVLLGHAIRVFVDFQVLELVGRCGRHCSGKGEKRRRTRRNEKKKGGGGGTTMLLVYCFCLFFFATSNSTPTKQSPHPPLLPPTHTLKKRLSSRKRERAREEFVCVRVCVDGRRGDGEGGGSINNKTTESEREQRWSGGGGVVGTWPCAHSPTHALPPSLPHSLTHTHSEHTKSERLSSQLIRPGATGVAGLRDNAPPAAAPIHTPHYY